MVKKKMMMKRKMYKENEMKLHCECGLNYSLIHIVIKGEKMQ